METDSGYEVGLDEVLPARIGALRRRVAIGPSLSEAILEMMAELYATLPPEVANAPGKNVILYLPHDSSRLDVDLVVGRHYEDGVPAAVEALDLPGGRVARTVHLGEYALLYQAHEATAEWAEAEGHTLAGPNWEIYDHWDEDPAKRRTDVFYLLE